MGGVWESLVHAIISGFMKTFKKENHVFQGSNSNNGWHGLHEWIIVTLTELFIHVPACCITSLTARLLLFLPWLLFPPTAPTAATLKRLDYSRTLNLCAPKFQYRSILWFCMSSTQTPKLASLLYAESGEKADEIIAFMHQSSS